MFPKRKYNVYFTGFTGIMKEVVFILHALFKNEYNNKTSLHSIYL